MELRIKNKLITEPIISILKTAKFESGNRYLKDIKDKGDNLLVTCPFHKDGQETTPACQVYARYDGNLYPGTFHCFACGVVGPLSLLIGHLFNEGSDFGESWLVQHYGDTFVETPLELPEITIKKSTSDKHCLPLSSLSAYNVYHPYLSMRGISRDVQQSFYCGYDQKLQAVTFPVWDEHNNLVFVTKRSVVDKRFYIPEGVEKPIYLLNFILQWNIKEVTICESQINALTLWSWGIPAVALFGTGSDYQYRILNKSGIRYYHLAFDGDSAGKHGILKFKENINRDVFIDVINIPYAKDVNNLTREQYLQLSHS